MSSSWIKYDQDSHFPIQNLPWGSCKPAPDAVSRPCVRIGEEIIDLKELAATDVFSHLPGVKDALQAANLNEFMGLGHSAWSGVRSTLQRVLAPSEGVIRDNASLKSRVVLPVDSVSMVMPATVGDYTDFYASKEHATNLGRLFRPDGEPLLPNWTHMPVGYHGRASSVVLSGTPVRRPCGQTRPDESKPPIYGPCKLLDFEIEVAAYFGGPGNALGEPLPLSGCKDKIFGLSLLNDWSARDIQKWEYVPLGPFLGKNFATTVAPWIVSLDALEPFTGPLPGRVDAELPYLVHPPAMTNSAYDINLTCSLTTSEGTSAVLSKTNMKHMYWSIFQQLAHHSVNGCPMRPGDILATGTISGPEKGSYGSMLEITWRGTQPVELPGGAVRRFIQDGDTVTMDGVCVGADYLVRAVNVMFLIAHVCLSSSLLVTLQIGFGSAAGQVLEAKPAH